MTCSTNLLDARFLEAAYRKLHRRLKRLNLLSKFLAGELTPEQTKILGVDRFARILAKMDWREYLPWIYADKKAKDYLERAKVLSLYIPIDRIDLNFIQYWNPGSTLLPLRSFWDYFQRWDELLYSSVFFERDSSYATWRRSAILSKIDIGLFL
jgi:hypothetical protein